MYLGECVCVLPDSIPGGIDVWFSCVVRICSLSIVLISIIDNGTLIILHSIDQNSNFMLRSNVVRLWI